MNRTASLDPDRTPPDWIRQHLETYRKENGATILLASHNNARSGAPCAEPAFIIMKRGRIEDDDSPDKDHGPATNRATLEEVFLDVAPRPRSGKARRETASFTSGVSRRIGSTP